ncbi:MAG: type II secretion system F family protein [Gemmatimonadetes bacterium]|nr:type II secretion system F family protein [Gemmatimonadota bacterium]
MTAAARWSYRAATQAGDVIEGVVQAGSQQEAMEELRRRALVPVAIHAGPVDRRSGRRWHGSRRDAVATAVRTLATMVAGGATLERSLQFSSTHAGHPDVAAALGEVRADVLAGHTLATALERRSALFGSLAPALVRAGEASGSLGASLERLADQLDAERDLRARLQGALLYPALLGVIAGLGVLVLLGFVVPRFVAMLDAAGAALPLSTRILVTTSAWVTRAGPVLLVAAGLGTIALRWFARGDDARLRWHGARLRLPLAGRIDLEVSSARFARTLGVLLDGGTPLLGALRMARDAVPNEFLARGIDGAIARVERGARLADALEGLLPPIAVQLLAVGEEGASLGPAAGRAADTLDGGVQRTLRQAVGLLEPLLIVVFGGLVGFIALAMLQAIYSINATLP